MTRHELADDDATGASYIEIEGPKGTLRLERAPARAVTKQLVGPVDTGPVDTGSVDAEVGDQSGVRLAVRPCIYTG